MPAEVPADPYVDDDGNFDDKAQRTDAILNSVPRPGERRPHIPQPGWGLISGFSDEKGRGVLGVFSDSRVNGIGGNTNAVAGYHVCVAVLGVKGGSGKTHAAVHLAYEAALNGEWVALVDVDPSRDASQWVENAGLNTREVYPEPVEADGVPVPITVFDLTDPALAKAAGLGDRRLLQAYIEQLLVDFTMVIIDSPANNQQLTQQLARYADAVVVPAHLGDEDYGHLGTTRQCLDDALTLRGGKSLREWVLINHVGYGREAVLRHMTGELRGAGWQVLPATVSLQNDYLLAKGRVPKGTAYYRVYHRMRAQLEDF